MIPFTTTVATRAPMAVAGSVAASLGPPGRSFVTDSCRICRNDTIMMIEKTSMPNGSSLRRPTGNLCCKPCIFHWTSLFVVQMIIVHNRSKAESTREAISDSDEEENAATIFAIRRKTLAMTLVYRAVSITEQTQDNRGLTLIAHLAFLSPFLLFSLSSSGSRGSMSPPVSLRAPPRSAMPSPSIS